MDERCKTCPCLCKRLGTEDEPAHYHFAKLTPADVIDLVETIATEYKFWELVVEQHAQATGPQLALWFKPNRKRSDGLDLLVIAEASDTSGGTDLWFRYGVPKEYCDDPPVVTGLSEMVRYTLDVLARTDDMLATRVLRPRM